MSKQKQIVHKVDVRPDRKAPTHCGAGTTQKRALFWRNVTCEACKKAAPRG